MIEATAWTEYKNMSAGIGDQGRNALKVCPIEGAQKRVLELGSGKGELLRILADAGHYAVGVDIAPGATTEYIAEHGLFNRPGSVLLLQLDLSRERLPFIDNFFDYAFCTETIEHLSDPYFMVAEAKRVLAPGAKFCLAFPMPESNLGYGGGKHPHVYPGFLQRESFERFMVQLFFKKLSRTENGDSAWYLYENVESGGQVDVFKMVSGNVDGNVVYAAVRGDVDCSI